MEATWKSSLSCLLLATAISSPAAADFVGLNIAADNWSPDISGSFVTTTPGDSTINLQDDLGFDDTSSSALTISFEHPIPILPNVRYQTRDLSQSSTSTGSFTFDGVPYSGDINSKLDLSNNELVLYYELLDNWVNLDLGLDLKMFDGKVSVSDSIRPTSTIDVDETIPMIYLSARFDLPLTGFYVGANIQQLSVGDSSAEDTSLMVGYESKIGLGIEGGIKTFSLELDDADDLNTDLEYDGVYLNGYFHF